MKKQHIVYLICALALAGLGAAGYLYQSAQAAGPNAYLNLNGPASINVGQTAAIQIQLNTDENAIYGADVILQYASDLLSAVGINKNELGTLHTYAPAANVGVDPTDPAFDPDFDWLQAIHVGESVSTAEFGVATFAFDPNADGNYADSAPAEAFSNTSPESFATLYLQGKPVRSNTQANLHLIYDGGTTDSNVIKADTLEDILAQPSDVNLNIIASPQCRAAVDHNDLVPGLNDLSYILPMFNRTCDDCLENVDMSPDGTVNLADLQFIVTYWGNPCSLD